MTDPYRDHHPSCPACQAPLRRFQVAGQTPEQARLVCDACDGIFVTPPDLAGAIHDLTSLVPTFEFSNLTPGARRCPRCSAPMTRCHVEIVLDTERARPKPELDVCGEHGVWFDREELAAVLEKVAGKGFGGGVGRTGGAARAGVLEGSQGGWTAVFKGRSGGWGGW